jgi:hypothetical protein
MRRRTAFAALAAGIALASTPVFGSGDPGPFPLYIDRNGGSPAELQRLFAGRLGVVTARSPRPLLYLDWRLLHGLEVGAVAGRALTSPCCGEPANLGPHDGVYGWLEARAIVPDVPESPYYITTDRPGPDYTVIPNCFRDAFDTAAATLRDRAARHGARSPEVRAWLLTQDSVFDSCASEGAALPPPMAGAPAWLAADRAYQEAAFELYNRRHEAAAARFEAIARNPASPWRGKGLYLRARALQRAALDRQDPESFARSRAALHELAAAPAGTYGQSEIPKMLRALAYRDRPDALRAELDSELRSREAKADVAVALRDYLTLGAKAATKPELVDWMETLAAIEGGPGLDHALDRWRATRDPAWLVAALSLVEPGEPAADSLAADASAVKPGEPAWLTAQYHLVRLTIAKADPASMRARLDSILARDDLSTSDRNLFAAARAQVATGLADFARFSLRRAFCGGPGEYCVGDDWARNEGSLAPHSGGWAGLGADARAIIDRLPLDSRIALSRMPVLPEALRLDIALTSFARAVQLQDDGAIDGLAGDLAALLPQMRRDWLGISSARPGPARRFAEYFAMAKLPGLRTDLIAYSYTRPQGTVSEFQGQWDDWAILPRGAAAAPAEPPDPNLYQSGVWYGGGVGQSDLACLGECGRGAFPLHLPAFAAALQDKAAAERAYFVGFGDEGGAPAGSLSAWEEALAYARAHPSDPRSPEMLYWLIHIARWGANHDHIGKRAFELLHARYAGSAWAKRSPYFYDP